MIDREVLLTSGQADYYTVEAKIGPSSGKLTAISEDEAGRMKRGRLSLFPIAALGAISL